MGKGTSYLFEGGSAGDATEGHDSAKTGMGGLSARTRNIEISPWRGEIMMRNGGRRFGGGENAVLELGEVGITFLLHGTIRIRNVSRTESSVMWHETPGQDLVEIPTVQFEHLFPGYVNDLPSIWHRQQLQ